MHYLFCQGLGGSPRLVDVGGVPYLVPLANKKKLYNLTEVARLAELPGAFMIGAGAGSSRVAGVNCEVGVHGNDSVRFEQRQDVSVNIAGSAYTGGS